jgi:hypothetical protein
MRGEEIGEAVNKQDGKGENWRGSERRGKT